VKQNNLYIFAFAFQKDAVGLRNQRKRKFGWVAETSSLL